jgi:hypothetical protein
MKPGLKKNAVSAATEEVLGRVSGVMLKTTRGATKEGRQSEVEDRSGRQLGTGFIYNSGE